MALVAAAACYSGRVENGATGPISQAEQQARLAIQNEQALAGQRLTERTVGVPAFGTEVRDTTLSSLGYGLADLLLTDLARSQRLVVVERLRLDAVLRELELARSGRVEEGTAPRVGRLVQARYLILGSVSDMPNGELRINTRIAEVPTSDIGRPLAFSAPVQQILDAEKALALRLLEELGVAASPQLRAELEQPATRNFAALLAYSRGVRGMAQRQLPAAAAEFESALQLDPGFVPAQRRLAEVRAELNATTRSARGRRAAGELALEQLTSMMTLSFADHPGGPVDPGYPTTRAFLIVNVRAR
jgi:TolB-like protein